MGEEGRSRKFAPNYQLGALLPHANGGGVERSETEGAVLRRRPEKIRNGLSEIDHLLHTRQRRHGREDRLRAVREDGIEGGGHGVSFTA